MILSAKADARPISYPGGWTVMQLNNGGETSSIHAHYSPTFKDSVGLYAERSWLQDKDYVGIQYNRLLKRWNETGAQANLYAKSSIGGVSDFDSNKTELAGFVGFAADWETRRWFTAYEARAEDFGNGIKISQSARLGIAPYIGDYGDLHTWLMLDVAHREETTYITPLMRLFYNVHLVELGYTPQNDTLTVNWVVRF